ncbi:MAG TPA: FHA domain-containing protein [Kofleriaceae bacterium]
MPPPMPTPMAPPMYGGPTQLPPQQLGFMPTGLVPPVALGNLPPPVALGGLPPPRAEGSMVACPRCGTQTPLGFAYCQQCGLHMQALQAPEPLPEPAPSPGPGQGQGQGQGIDRRLDAPIDPHAGTLAHDHLVPMTAAGLPPSVPTPAPTAAPNGNRALPRPQLQTGPSWGTAVLVNRDGSDGQRFPLTGEYLVVGRAGADIAFDDDRFLARQHARLDRAADGQVAIQPLDQLNGVFRKADAPVELSDGMIILVGREVLRFERLDAEEIKVHPLVRHGVALFGSPPREPWGRLIQIVPSGGYRDVRHLVAEEVVLGREEGEIVFRDDAFMSRRHAALTWNGKVAQVIDLGSSNGTFIRITGPTPLKHGDHVRMGDQLLRLELGR